MTFNEILREQCLTKEQILTIRSRMHDNRIYLTREQKIEERYEKLKKQRNEMGVNLIKAQGMIEDLERNIQKENNLKDTFIALFRELISN